MTTSRHWAYLRIGIAAIAIFLVVGIVDSPLFTFYRISGNSMRPSFFDGDRVVVTNLPFVVGGPDVGDAVIAKHEGEILIKRVMGCPGDVVEVRAGVVYVDGDAMEEPAPTETRDFWSHGPIQLAPDEYFLMGDNRRVSVDSRTFGPVTGGDILGLVFLRISGSDEDVSVTAAEMRH